MAKLAMKKIEIVALLSDSKKIIERLQRRGVIELYDYTDENLVKTNTLATISIFEKKLNSVLAAYDVLSEYIPKKKLLLAMLNGRTPIDKDDFGKHTEKVDDNLYICEEILKNSKKITDNNNSIVQLQTQIDSMKIWESLDIPLKYDGTQKTKFFIGTIPDKLTSEIISEKIRAVDTELDAFEIEVVSSFKEQTCIVAVCHRDDEKQLFNALREINFVAQSDAADVLPIDRIRQLKDEIKAKQKETSESVEAIKSVGDIFSELEFLVDYFTMRKEKYDILNKLAMTENTFILTGYIPEKFADKLTQELESRYSVAISVEDPSDEDDVPVLLENNKFVEPVEGITEMYALPGKGDVDPNPVMSFFYYLLFGMMLSDAGYGLLMWIGTSIILKKTTVEGNLRRSLIMFRNCGVTTLFWGALFGSWFGDIVQVVAREFFNKEIGSLALWFEPLADPIKLLLFSFGIGIVHLFFGLAMNFKKLWQQGKKLDAVFDTIPVYLTILGVAPIGASILSTVPPILTEIGKYLAIVGVISIILTAGRSSKNIIARLFGGVYGLYNIATGYLSDILSYSRLLALGLATGSIASVINLIGIMPSNPVVKAIALIVVFIIGHAANMAINLLGAYVHTDRLQFVEMFSKFYEGGGRAFKPFKVNTKFIKFKEEQ